MGRQKGTDGENRTETVVSVRFSSDEVARLRRLAETRDLPLSTLIRQASLAAFVSQPLVLRPSINQGGAGCGWILYDSRSATVKAGSTTRPHAAAVSYRSSINTALCGLFVPKAEQRVHNLSQYSMYRLVTVHWSPSASVPDWTDCHSVCHSGQRRSCVAAK